RRDQEDVQWDERRRAPRVSEVEQRAGGVTATTKAAARSAEAGQHRPADLDTCQERRRADYQERRRAACKERRRATGKECGRATGDERDANPAASRDDD